jgi:hypothetical protein
MKTETKEEAKMQLDHALEAFNGNHTMLNKVDHINIDTHVDVSSYSSYCLLYVFSEITFASLYHNVGILQSL